MATITYHTLHAATTVTIPEDVVVDGQVVTKAGTYDFQNDGKYWTGFDRTDPIQAAAREQIWTATALALVGELGVGSVTASALTMGLGIAALFALDRTHGGRDRPRAGVGDASLDREGQGRRHSSRWPTPPDHRVAGPRTRSARRPARATWPSPVW